MNYKKIFFSFVLTALGIFIVFILWKESIPLAGILAGLAYFKHKIYPVKKELLCFLVVGILGSGFESLLISNGAWKYVLPDFFNIPFWLPFLWGLIGITTITFYEGLTEKNR